MTGKLIVETFNQSNRVNLWKLRDYHGKLGHTYCDPAIAVG
jgi:histidinol phosphatase-like enzyme